MTSPPSLDPLDLAAAQVVLLASWMSALDIPGVFRDPVFSIDGAAPLPLDDAAIALCRVPKPIRVGARDAGDFVDVTSESWSRREAVAGWRWSAPEPLVPELRLENAVILFIGGTVRLRVPAAVLERLANGDYTLASRPTLSGSPASHRQFVDLYLPEHERAGVTWVYLLGGMRHGRPSCPIWLAPYPPNF